MSGLSDITTNLAAAGYSISSIKVIQIPWVPAVANQLPVRVHDGNNNLVIFTPNIDVDPNGVNPQNSRILVSRSSDGNPASSIPLARHCRDAVATASRQGETWYATSTVATGNLVVIELAKAGTVR